MLVSRWIGVSLLPAALVAVTAARSPARPVAAATALCAEQERGLTRRQ